MSTYSFESHSQAAAIKVLDIGTGQSTTFSEDAKYSEPSWISENEFVLVKSETEGTSLVVADATKPGTEYVCPQLEGHPGALGAPAVMPCANQVRVAV